MNTRRGSLALKNKLRVALFNLKGKLYIVYLYLFIIYLYLYIYGIFIYLLYIVYCIFSFIHLFLYKRKIRSNRTPSPPLKTFLLFYIFSFFVYKIKQTRPMTLSPPSPEDLPGGYNLPRGGGREAHRSLSVSLELNLWDGFILERRCPFFFGGVDGKP